MNKTPASASRGDAVNPARRPAALSSAAGITGASLLPAAGFAAHWPRFPLV